MNKRTFLKSMTLAGIGGLSSLDALAKLVDENSNRLPDDLAKDEDFWAGVRKGYRLKPDYINLENGYYCFLPQETLENFINHVREVNYQGSYYMRTVQWDNKKKVAARLAQVAGGRSPSPIPDPNSRRHSENPLDRPSRARRW
jgi:hypothetical protein